MFRLQITRFFKSILVYVITVILNGALAVAQCPPVYTFTGEATFDFFGSAVASAGDVDNDGFDDLIVSAKGSLAGGSFSGRVFIFSGLTGDTIHVYDGEGKFADFGFSVASAGDVDNDGFDDLIVGAPLYDASGFEDGRAYVFSGQTGNTIYVFTGEAEADRFGFSVSSAGDVNEDGFSDLIVGAPFNDAGGGASGRAYVFSGKNGDTIYVLSANTPAEFFGISVASGGDVDNDGVNDLIIGAVGNRTAGFAAGGAYVFSGKTGAQIYFFSGEATLDEFGRSVSSAGDINNDGYDDLIVGAYHNDYGGADAGRAYVFSGQTGALMYVFTGETEDDRFGFSVNAAGDVNNDGFYDLIVGAPTNDAAAENAGRAYVFSGQTGDKIYIFNGEKAGDVFGLSVASAGDVDMDGFSDLIVGAYNSGAGSNIGGGKAYVYSGRPCNCADANGDLVVNLDDIAFLQTYYSQCGIAPFPLSASDVNCDGIVDIQDIIYLASYLNASGPAPCCQ